MAKYLNKYFLIELNFFGVSSEDVTHCLFIKVTFVTPFNEKSNRESVFKHLLIYGSSMTWQGLQHIVTQAA